MRSPVSEAYSLCLADIVCDTWVQVSSVVKMGDGDNMSVVTNTGTINDVDCLLWAIGRFPNIESLCLDRVVSILSHDVVILLQTCQRFRF